MTNTEKLMKINELIAALAEIFHTTLSAPAFELYSKLLIDIPFEKLEQTFLNVAKNSKRFPTPAEIRDAASCGPGAELAKAWESVIYAIRNYGAYSRVTFNGRINATIKQMGGWVRLCDLGGDKLHVWAKKEFTDLYAENIGANNTGALDVLDSTIADAKPTVYVLEAQEKTKQLNPAKEEWW